MSAFFGGRGEEFNRLQLLVFTGSTREHPSERIYSIGYQQSAQHAPLFYGRIVGGMTAQRRSSTDCPCQRAEGFGCWNDFLGFA